MPDRRQRMFALLYFAEGAPIGFIWWTLPTALRSAGVPVESITALTSLVVLPWALKFAWAPLVDALRGPRFGLRAWIVVAQVLMALSLVPLLFVGELASSLPMLTGLLVVHALAAATQDVAIDALSIATVPEEERGALNGWMQAGMLVGRAAFGGGALLLGSALDPRWMVGAMIAVLLATSMLVLRADLVEAPPEPGRGRRFFREALAMLVTPGTWIAFAFALSGEATFKGVGSVVGPYLIDHGIAQETVGVFFGVGSVSAMVVGALVGGRLADRVGRRRVILAGQLTMAIAVVTLAWVGEARSLPAIGWAALATFYLGVGLFTAASFAMFMDMTDPRIGATQFSAYMGLTNACEAWSTRAVGEVVSRSGYGVAFTMAAGLGTLALALVPWLRPRDYGSQTS